MVARACMLALFAMFVGLCIGVLQTTLWEQLNSTFDYVAYSLQEAASRYH